MTRRSKKTSRRIVRRTAQKRNRRHGKPDLQKDQSFNALKIAQDILDHNRTIVVYGNKIGVVHAEGKESVYSATESQKVMTEFHEMFDIAKRCTHLCDPLRQKLQELLFICQPIGLTHARYHEAKIE